MSQLGPYLRKGEDQLFHWCPACGEAHVYNIGPGRPHWDFNGDPLKPSFTPSMKITGKQTVKDDKGEWTGEWVCDAAGKALDYCCHYFITDGFIEYCGDCTHGLSGQKVPLPELPEHLREKIS